MFIQIRLTKDMYKLIRSEGAPNRVHLKIPMTYTGANVPLSVRPSLRTSDIFTYIYTSIRLNSMRTVTLQIQNLHTKNIRVDISWKFLMDLGIPPLEMNNMLGSNPLKSRFLVRGLAVRPLVKNNHQDNNLIRTPTHARFIPDSYLMHTPMHTPMQ